MDLRPYLPTDRAACLAVLDSTGCAPEQRKAFARHLDRPAGPFFVMEHDGAIVGCGGYEIADDVARLNWGAVRREFQAMGLGRLLLMYRLREIGKAGNIQRVLVDAPVQTAAFFEKQGFKIMGQESSRIQLVKKLTVCA